MRWRLGVFVCLAVSGLWLAGCGGTSESTAAGNDRAQDEFSMEQRLGALGARIDSLRDQAELQGNVVAHEAADSLEVEKQRATKQLAQMRAATSDRWDQVKGETADALDALARRLEEAEARLREK